MGQLPAGHAGTGPRRYFEFHVQVTGCRLCQANLADLQHQQSTEPAAGDERRKKYFQSSAGHLRSHAK